MRDLKRSDRLFIVVMFNVINIGLFSWAVYFSLRGKHEVYPPEWVLSFQLVIFYVLSLITLYFVCEMVLENYKAFELEADLAALKRKEKK
jgi:hypothetical protein